MSERQRQRLRHWAGEHMDEETADIFMASTPPTGGGDVATRSDVRALETALRTLETVLTATFAAKLPGEIGGVYREMGKRRQSDKWQTITILVAILAAMLGDAVLPRWFSPPPPPPPQIIVPMPGTGGASLGG